MINLNKLKRIGRTKNKDNRERAIRNAGFTLFVAMIVSSLLLAVGFSIGNIILKQLLLAGSGKDSQVAFYAADSGAECVQFWDTKDEFGKPVVESPFFSTTTSGAISGIKCGTGEAGAVKVVSADIATTTVYIDFSDTAEEKYQACAMVVIEKGFTDVVVDGLSEKIPYTRIASRGYNTDAKRTSGVITECDTVNQRAVERGLLIQY